MPAPSFLRAQPDGTLLSVKVQPRARGDEIAGAASGELKIKVTALPVDAAANEALLRLLAEKLGCAQNRVELVRGHQSRHKVIKLHGITPSAALQKLLPDGPDSLNLTG
jgi:uncharacterized protein (TIGR00251 family)